MRPLFVTSKAAEPVSTGRLETRTARSRKPRVRPSPPRELRTLDDIRDYFAQRERRVYFVSASNFNMIGMHQWVSQWHNINLIDCFDGQHPVSTVVRDDHSRLFSGIEDVNHYLLESAVVRNLFQSRSDVRKARGQGPEDAKDQVLFLFFDPALEAKCRDLGLDVAMPPNALIREVDSKIVTTEIGNACGVYSVPNVMAHVGSYAELQLLARDAGLGERWVVQAAYGDSGKTTYFIANESDYNAVAAEIESQDSVKVMRWVRCVGSAIEACATRWGTVVGPLLTELIGQPELTPYVGGWCGNENYASAYTPEARAQVMTKTQAFGDALYRRGYRGTFELDYLMDLDSGEIYLGELNARITGVTAITNTSAFSQQYLPLFLFHLLEFDGGVDLTLDLHAFNEMMLLQGADERSSQIILKHSEATLKMIAQAPSSGVYTLTNDTLELKETGCDRALAKRAGEAYLLRIQDSGEITYKGADKAILFVNAVIRNADGALNAEGLRWTHALQKSFAMRDLTQEEASAVALKHRPANVKSSGA